MASIFAGGIAAFVSGLAALVIFVWLLKSQRFFTFSWYAWIAGGSFLAWLTLT
jgi:undecaprenyl pyrophosphate phosphatase UppP